MSTLEIQKEQLQQRIKNIDDEKLLEKILNIVNEEMPIYKLSEAQRASIQRGLDDVKAGRVTSDEDAEKELDEWLAEEE